MGESQFRRSVSWKKCNMRLVLLAACLALVSASEVKDDKVKNDTKKKSVVPWAACDKPLKFYHENVGISEAKRIEEAEKETPVDSMAPAGTYPYFIGLVITLTSGATSVCGSSILTNTKSVTAAHCWWDGDEQASEFELVFGSARLFSGGVRVKTDDIKMHTHWNPNNLNNDIAIISCNYVRYTELIQPVALPSDELLNNNFADDWAQAVGFGAIKDIDGQLLSHVNLQVITNEVCQQSFGSFYVIASTLCTSGAGGVDACGADSGGPLTIISNGNPVLIGLTSFNAALGCQRELPSAFTRITSYVSWIKDKLLSELPRLKSANEDKKRENSGVWNIQRGQFNRLFFKLPYS